MSAEPAGARRARRLRAWAAGSPTNLAVFRVTVGVVLLMLPDLHRATAWAALPDRVRTAPVGLGWAMEHLPMTPEIARPLYLIVIAAAVLGIAGLATRTAWAVVTLASLYLLAIPQFAGSVFHYHHLLWFSALLAASPSGDALSLDRLIGRGRGRPPPPRRGLAYGVPIRAAWLLVGVIFFFPGAHKLAHSGWAWIWSDNLTNQMYAKWLQMPDFEPLFRVDRYPTLVRLGALATVALELSFVALVLFRRTRPWAVLAALAFHQATARLMGLRFDALWLCYVVFVDWDGLVRRLKGWARREERGSAPEPPEPRQPPEPPEAPERPEAPVGARLRSSAPAMAVAATLLLGNVAYGAAGISDGWPFACYPKFHRTVGRRLPALRVEVVRADGRAERIPVAAMSPGGPTQRWWAVSWSLMGAHERARADPRRWRAFWSRVARRPAVAARSRGAVAVRFYRDVISTVPEERAAPPRSSRLLYELPLDPLDPLDPRQPLSPR